MSNDGKKVPVERAVELLVYAPVGVAMYLRDTVPTFVNLFVSRGRSEVKNYSKDARKQVTQAKSMGEFAVGFGGPKLLQKVEEGVSAARKGAETVLANLGSVEGEVAITDHDAPRRRPAEKSEVARGTAAGSNNSHPPRATPVAASSNGELVIPDYDELSASQVVERLEGLRREELDAVRAYEAANRGRRTILFKIEQLSG